MADDTSTTTDPFAGFTTEQINTALMNRQMAAAAAARGAARATYQAVIPMFTDGVSMKFSEFRAALGAFQTAADRPQLPDTDTAFNQLMGCMDRALNALVGKIGAT